MKVKKIGHCCLIIETNGKRIMTDPGSYTIDEQEMETNIDLVLITHEHMDHLHIDSLKNIIAKNPEAIVVTNSGVGKILTEAGIVFQKLEDGQSGDFAGVSLEAYGDMHAEIYDDFAMVQNTGYFFDKKLFYPGDAFVDPGQPVEILAMPASAPWLKMKDAIQYTIKLKPRICFPVHDWNLKNSAFVHKIPEIFLGRAGILFKVLEIGKEEEL